MKKKIKKSHLSKIRIKKNRKEKKGHKNEKLALDVSESKKTDDVIVCSSAASFIYFFVPILLCVPVKTRTRGESSQSLRERGKKIEKNQGKRKSQEILSHKQLSLVECLINQQRQKGTTINKETPSSQRSAVNHCTALHCTALAKEEGEKIKIPLRELLYTSTQIQNIKQRGIKHRVQTTQSSQ